MSRLISVAFVLWSLGAPVVGVVAQCHDLDGVTAVGEDLLAQAPLLGSSCVRVEQSGTAVYEECFGSFTPQRVVPIASATKTLSAAVLLSLVDDGLLALDDRVGQYLPEWNFGAKAAITLRMCFAHTSGMPTSHPATSDPTITLRDAAFRIALAPLDNVPGTAFAYGGPSMQVAGAVCEVASGQSWATLFQQRIAGPLAMVSTDYEHQGQTANPLIGGGARSNLRDYARFVAMLRRGGTGVGPAGVSRVLSAAAVDVMLQDQTVGTTTVSTPHPNGAPYGLGIWVEQKNGAGETTLAVAAGAFGFMGWLDRDHDSSGVLSVQYWFQAVYPFAERIWRQLDDALLPAGVQCLGVGSPPCRPGTWLNATSPAVSGNDEFALRVSRAPLFAVGGVAIGDSFPGGVAIADLTAFVGPAIDLVATVSADGTGRAVVPAPLPPGLVGATFALQTVWFGYAPCTALGLQASHAIEVTVF